MKKSELKEMIKAAFLSEADFTNAQDDDAAPAIAADYDPLAEEEMYEEEDLDEMLARLSEEEVEEGDDKVVDPYLAEAEEEEEDVDVEVDVKDTDLSADDEEVESANDSIVVDKKIVSLSSLPGETRKILDTLETLRAQAEEFGDQKFITQVGNTITFFTRDFVVAGDAPNPAGIEESAASNLELKNVAKQLYLGFKKMGADVELVKGEVVLNKKPADGTMDSKDVFLYSEDDRVVADLVGDKAIEFYDKIQKGFPQFEFKDGGDGRTWNGAKTKRLVILPGKTTSESLNESVFPMWNKIK